MEYTFKTKQMVKASEKIGTYYDLQASAYNADIGKLAKLISIFGDVAEDKAFDYIDEQLDNGNTVKGLYEEIFKGIMADSFLKLMKDI